MPRSTLLLGTSSNQWLGSAGARLLRDTRGIDRSTAARVEWIRMLQRQDQRFVL